MSKNGQMLSESVQLVGPAIATTGAVSLVQGVYGARGNLELVACDAADGLWVFWFNANVDGDPDDSPEVPRGTWSAGLRFAGGSRYRDAQIVQSTLGPDHLEVLALDAGGTLQSWYWSPGPGFQRRVTDAATDVARFHLVHVRGELRVTVTDESGKTRHLASTPAGYPERGWAEAPDGPGSMPDATDALVGAGVPASDILPGTARSSRSRRRGGTTEFTWRGTDGGIRHLGVADA